MNIIDSHLHFWDLSNNINNWVFTENNWLLEKNYMPDTLIQKFNGSLYGVVHIEAHDSAISTIKEVEWLSKVIKNVQQIKCSHIAYVDITLPKEEFANNIHKLIQYKNVSGIRHILSYNPKFAYSPCNSDLSTNPNIYDNLKCLAHNKLIFDCQMYPYQLTNILNAIEGSGVTCIIDHLVLPAWNKKSDNDHNMWKDIIIKLSQLNNVFIKVSGIDMFRPENEFKSVIDFCFNHFPINRLIYGSNYPVSFTHDCNYWYNYLNAMNLSDSAKEQLFFTNAFKIFFE